MTELHYTPNLLQIMDCLWFHPRVLFSEHISLPIIEPTSTPQTISQTSLASSMNSDFSAPTLSEEVSFLSDTPPSSLKDDDSRGDTEADDDDETGYDYRRKRPTRLTLVSSETRSHSSSPSKHKVPKHLRNIGGMSPLRKTMSCKTLFELEYEEVKGFMDLGFTFNKEKLCPRMMSVIPGLQRLDEYEDGLVGQCFDAAEELKGNEVEMLQGTKNGVMRPYLSEAWLIKRPDSPLLNLRIPRVSNSSDMKKHLKSWARTVASAIQVEY